MSRAIGAHVPRGHRQQAAARSQVWPSPGYTFAAFTDRQAAGFAAMVGVAREALPGGPWVHTLTLTQPDPPHYEPHHCAVPGCGMCLCACRECHLGLINACICPDCPCGLGETGSDAEVAEFEAAHWAHAEEETA